MADQNINPVGCLGRVLTILGTLWLGFLVLAGIGLVSDVGISEGFFAGAFGSAIPGVLLLWAGRALRRRARTMERQIEPVAPAPAPGPTEKRVPTIRIESSQMEMPSAPKPPPPTTGQAGAKARPGSDGDSSRGPCRPPPTAGTPRAEDLAPADRRGAQEVEQTAFVIGTHRCHMRACSSQLRRRGSLQPCGGESPGIADLGCEGGAAGGHTVGVIDQASVGGK